MEMTLLIGLGIVAALLLFLAFLFKDIQEHFALRLLAVSFFLFILILIPKTTVDTNNYCSLEINESTTIGNTTTYDYDRVCVDNTTNTSNIFYKVTVSFVALFFLYIIIYFIIQQLRTIGMVKKRK